MGDTDSFTGEVFLFYLFFLSMQFMFLKYFRNIFISWGHNKP